MNRRTLTQRAATTVALAASAIVLGAHTAAAEPQPTPVERAIADLTTAAGDNADAKTALEATAKTAKLLSAVKLTDVAGVAPVSFAPFSYQAPTIGCGTNFPFTMTAASAISGTEGPDTGLNTAPGTIRFQAAPVHSGMPLASGLTVMWLNVANGRSGINMLDDLTEYNLPALTKTVDSGAGTVVASLWGSIDYPAARCMVLPTVGLFTVAEVPKDPAQGQTSSGSADSGSGGTAATPTTGAAPTSAAAPAPGSADGLGATN